ncbi:MAG: CehA/McbA family metallohydrolase [Bacillota bacterium]|nr:CehA/McbA family metallohydrolase [Bacillota bacterium]
MRLQNNMFVKFSGNIGSGEKLPLQIHRFTILKPLSCLQINISTSNKSWMQVFLWDNNNKLRLQLLHLDVESAAIIHEKSEKSHPCAIPGILMPGEYTLELMCASQELIEYDFEITDNVKPQENEETMEVWGDGNSESPLLYLNAYDFSKKMEKGLRWYKGDFHTHTTLSDGKMTLQKGTEKASSLGLDFFVATDHNILPCQWHKTDILVIPGIEITAMAGHFNAIGLKQWIDFRINSEDGGLTTEKGMNRLMRQAKEKGALCSVNHPELYPWQWLFEKTLLENIDTLEIINDPTYPQNKEASEKALKLWTLLWKEGYKIWGIGGSDSHLLPTENYDGSDKPSLIGDPGTYVLADGLSAEEIIEGVSKGRVYVSREVEMDIEINCGGENYYLGSDLTELFTSEQMEKVITYRVSFNGPEEEYILSVIENGRVIESKCIDNGKSCDINLIWKGTGYVWNRLELRKKNGDLLLFTNPIFKGEVEHKIFTWGQLIELSGGH